MIIYLKSIRCRILSHLLFHWSKQSFVVSTILFMYYYHTHNLLHNHRYHTNHHSYNSYNSYHHTHLLIIVSIISNNINDTILIIIIITINTFWELISLLPFIIFIITINTFWEIISLLSFIIFIFKASCYHHPYHNHPSSLLSSYIISSLASLTISNQLVVW